MQKLPPVIRSAAAYAPSEAVDGKSLANPFSNHHKVLQCYVFCTLFSGGFFVRHFELLSISIISIIYRYILSFSCSDIFSTNCTAVRYFSVEPNLS